jgi:hypothetical protein
MNATQCYRILLASVASVVLAARVDATTVTIDPSSQDTFILEDSPNALKGTTARIKARSRAAKRWRGLVQFDLSSIPQFSTINSATLRLYEVAPPGVAKTHGVHLVSDPWLQSTAKWSNQPAHAASATATTAVGTIKGERTFTVTPDVRSWVDDPPTNHGWMVIDQAEGDTNWDIVKYVARETRDNATHKPKLDVDFTAPACATNADCADANPCTVNERCQAGHCAVNPRSCEEQPSNLCTDDICDPGQPPGQECVHSSKCDDGFSCTDDSCNPGNGVCTNTPIDSNCTAEGCKVGTCVADPDGTDLDEAGCFITITYPDGTSCTPDSNQCTDDTCSAGQCTHPFLVLGTPCAADGNPCTDDICDGAGACGHPNNTAPCDDGLFCTGTDTCSGGSCQHTGDPCAGGPECNNVCNEVGDNCDVAPGTLCTDDGNVCTDDQCDGAGACGHPNNTAPCDDGLFCTVNDTCESGVCQGSARDCNAVGDQCHDGVCDENTNQCVGPPKADGTPCNDGNACTTPDTCTAGTCAGPLEPEACLDHFTCYKSGATRGSIKFLGIPNPPGLLLEDQFGPSTVEVKKPQFLCAPTDKNNENPGAELHTEHLKGYPIKNLLKPVFPTNIRVVDQFNPTGLFVNAKKQSHLLVPTVKSLTGPTPVPTPGAFTIDHFECYKVSVTPKTTKFLPVLVLPIKDQFGSMTVDVRKPKFLCNPVDKQGEDPTAPAHTAHLMCYQVKQVKTEPQFQKVLGVFVNNQFGPEQLDVKKPSELCVPALKNP